MLLKLHQKTTIENQSLSPCTHRSSWESGEVWLFAKSLVLRVKRKEERAKRFAGQWPVSYSEEDTERNTKVMTMLPNLSQVFAPSKNDPICWAPWNNQCLGALSSRVPNSSSIATLPWEQKNHYLLLLFGKLCPRPYRELELAHPQGNILSSPSETIPAWSCQKVCRCTSKDNNWHLIAFHLFDIVLRISMY